MAAKSWISIAEARRPAAYNCRGFDAVRAQSIRLRINASCKYDMYNIINMSVGVAGRNYSHTHMYQWLYTFSKLHIKPFSHWVKVLRPTRHKIAHFGDVSQANLLAWYRKTKPNITKARIHQLKQCTTTQSKHKKLRSDLVASYDIQHENVEVLFLFRCFINLSLTNLLRHLPTYSQPRPTQGSYDLSLSHCTIKTSGNLQWH